MKRFSFSIILLAILFSCSKEDFKESQEVNNQLDYNLTVLSNSGIDLNNVEVMDSYFIVDGDMIIPFEAIPEIEIALNQEPTGIHEKAYKYSNPYYATLTAVKDIKIYIEPSVLTNNWNKAVQDAVTAWNTVSNTCAVKMRFVSTKAEANISISTFINDTSQTVAWANLCVSGRVGSQVSINTRYNYYSESKKLNTIVHELGHTIGFAHSDGKDTSPTPLLITGTSSADNSRAVMYKYTHDWYDFTSDERLASSTLYSKLVVSVWGFPTRLYPMDLGRTFAITASSSQSNVTYNWSWSGGTYVSGQGTSRLNIIAGSPVTFGISVRVTNTIGEYVVVNKTVQYP